MLVKRSAVEPEMLVHEGPARVFDSEEEAIAAICGKKKGDVVVIGAKALQAARYA